MLICKECAILFKKEQGKAENSSVVCQIKSGVLFRDHGRCVFANNREKCFSAHSMGDEHIEKNTETIV